MRPPGHNLFSCPASQVICALALIGGLGLVAGCASNPAEHTNARPVPMPSVGVVAPHLGTRKPANPEWSAWLGLLDAEIAQNDGDTGAHLNRGRIRRWEGDYAGAIRDFDTVIAQGDAGPGYLERGRVKTLMKDYDGAVADYDRALRLDPQNGVIYEMRAITFHDDHQLARAIADYGRAIALLPPDVVLYSDRGDAKRESGDLSGAIRDYSKAISLDPRNPRYFAVKGDIESKGGQLSAAIADYSRALVLAPDQPEWYAARAGVRDDSGDHAGAIADATRCLHLDPKSAKAYRVRGRARYFLHRYPAALTDLKTALALDPQWEEIYDDLASTYLGMHETDRARAAFSAGLRLNPHDAVARLDLGVIYYRAHDYPKARTELDAAITADPSLARSYALRARVNAETGHIKAAIADGRQAAKLLPHDGGNFALLAGCFVREGRPAEAITAANAAIAWTHAEANRISAHLMRGIARAQLREWTAAIQDFDYVIAYDPALTMARQYRNAAAAELAREQTAGSPASPSGSGSAR